MVISVSRRPTHSSPRSGPSGAAPFRHLVYPLPFDGGLGIHATNDLSGAVRFGPDVSWVEEIDYGFDEPFDLNEWVNIRKGTRAIVDLEKPAHTYYSLNARTPGFIVAQRATVASDTLLWKQSNPIFA